MASSARVNHSEHVMPRVPAALMRVVMRRSSLVTAITALLLSTGFPPARANRPAVEASTNFDLEAVPKFLERVASLLSGGFGTKDASEVAAQIAAMDFESTREWTFQVTYRGAQSANASRSVYG